MHEQTLGGIANPYYGSAQPRKEDTLSCAAGKATIADGFDALGQPSDCLLRYGHLLTQ